MYSTAALKNRQIEIRKTEGFKLGLTTGDNSRVQKKIVEPKNSWAPGS